MCCLPIISLSSSVGRSVVIRATGLSSPGGSHSPPNQSSLSSSVSGDSPPGQLEVVELQLRRGGQSEGPPRGSSWCSAHASDETGCQHRDDKQGSLVDTGQDFDRVDSKGRSECLGIPGCLACELACVVDPTESCRTIPGKAEEVHCSRRLHWRHILLYIKSLILLRWCLLQQETALETHPPVY